MTIRAGPLRLIRLLLCLALFVVAGSGWFLRPEMLRELKQLREPESPLVNDVLELIRRHYADSLGEEDLRLRAVTGILRSLPDPYASLLASGDLKGYHDLLEGSSGDAGLRLLDGPLGLTVGEVVSGSPADKAGIRPGDRVLRVDQVQAARWSTPRAEQALRGEPGSRVALTLRSPEESTLREVKLDRVRLSDVNPAMRLLGPGVGYIRLSALTRGSKRSVETAVSRLVAKGATGLVLDLRGNRGGLLEEATSVLEMFLDAGSPIGTVQGRNKKGTHKLVAAEGQRWPHLNVIVLVNAETASAAEVIAATLQDNHRAVLIGQPTYGKSHVQGTLKLSDGLSVRISIARWITPNGRRLDREHGNVVVPDVVVSPWKPSPGDDSLRLAIGDRSDLFRRVFEEAVRRGEWQPPEDSAVANPGDRVLLRRLKKAGITLTSEELSGGAGLMEQEWAVLVAAHAETQQPATGRRRAPDAQLLAAWRMLEAGETGLGGGHQR
jgi:carboxyl-terminal processing protease